MYGKFLPVTADRIDPNGIAGAAWITMFISDKLIPEKDVNEKWRF